MRQAYGADLTATLLSQPRFAGVISSNKYQSSRSLQKTQRPALSVSCGRMSTYRFDWQVIRSVHLICTLYRSRHSFIARRNKESSSQELSVEDAQKPLPPRSGHCIATLPKDSAGDALIFGG